MRSAVLLPLLAFLSYAQAPAPSPYESVLGTVTSIDAAGHVVAVKTDKSGDTTVKFDEKTSFRVVPPGETNVAKATPGKSTDLSVGDRVLARVRTQDPTGMPANAVYVMKQAAIAQRNEKTKEDWQTQSVAGLVKAVDAAGKQVTIAVRGPSGAPRDVTIDLAAANDVRRLNPDTLKYEDSPASAILQGDQLRVLGEKNADASQIKAEAIMFASLRSIPVLIKGIDPATNTITATDLGSKKPISIMVKADTSMKKLDEQTAMMLARRLNPSFQGGGQGGGRGRGRGDDTTAAGDAPATGRGPGGGGRGRGGAMDLNRVLDQQAAVQLADLKPGDPLIVTGAASADMARLTATALVAGVDPILRAAPQNGPDPLGGNWNLGDGGPPAQ
jgi:hypothetical protein